MSGEGASAPQFGTPAEGREVCVERLPRDERAPPPAHFKPFGTPKEVRDVRFERFSTPSARAAQARSLDAEEAAAAITPRSNVPRPTLS